MKTWKIAGSCSFVVLGLGLVQSDLRAGQQPRLLRPPAALRAKADGSKLLSQLARNSDRILIGRVVTVNARPQGPGGEPGIHSEIELEVEIAQGVKVRVVKSTLSDVRPHGTKPAND